eukprot:gene12410-15600_t
MSYTCKPITPLFGALIEDLSLLSLRNLLSSPNASSAALVSSLRSDLAQHRLLLFRHPDNAVALGGDGCGQVEISKAVGESGQLESTFHKHAKSPHPDIFRVSNDEDEGCTNVGRSGWHIDGTFQPQPFSAQTMYFPEVNKGGWTQFVPLKELFDSQTAERQALWRGKEREALGLVPRSEGPCLVPDRRRMPVQTVRPMASTKTVGHVA